MPSRLAAVSRRLVLRTTALAAAAGLASGGGLWRAGARAEPTPACDDGDEPTHRQTEGPFFKPRSPERVSLVEPGMAGSRIVLTGTVLTRACRPLPRVLVDLWHSDDKGVYDNAGFRLRGHQFTDAGGRYRFETIVPGLYPGRTRHFHIKAQAANRPVLTTQFYFPDEPGNRRDALFDPALLLRIAGAAGQVEARYDIVLAVP
jgi:protocatechuate 3,4-dioxygenase beta subunit